MDPLDSFNFLGWFLDIDAFFLQVNVQPCPGGAVGHARWRCVHHPGTDSISWMGSYPDLSECRSVWLSVLDSRTEEVEGSMINIANDLSQVSRRESHVIQKV